MNTEINVNKLKQVLISLSVINSSKIPQRIYEIKTLIKTKAWNNEDVIKKVKSSYTKLFNDDEKIHLSKVLVKKKKGNEENYWITREFHRYDNIYDQIAVAYFLFDIQFFKSLRAFYKYQNTQLRGNLGIDSTRPTNYGNITFKGDIDDKCSDDQFMPFYIDWKAQWRKFIKRIGDLSVERCYVVKLDFINAYHELNTDDFVKLHIHIDANTDKNKDNAINKLINIIKKYEYKNGEKITGVPYGGTVESHMIANYLILKKLHNICRQINSTNMFRVIDLISYADDSCIVLKSSNSKEEINEDDSSEMDVLIQLLNGLSTKYNFHSVKQDNKTKTHVFKINDKKDINLLKNSYSSSSTINALFTTQRISDNDFIIEWKTDQSIYDKSDHIFERKELVSKIYNTYLISSIKWSDFFNLDNVKFIPYLFTHMTIKFNSDQNIGLIIDNLFEYDKQRYFETIGVQEYIIIEALECLYTALECGVPISALCKLATKIKNWIKKNDDFIWLDDGLRYFYNEATETTDSSSTNIDTSLVIKLETYFQSLSGKDEKYESLVNVINKIANMTEKSCDYTLINIYQLFGFKIPGGGSDILYWQFTKISIINFFKELFKESEPFLFYRFKQFLIISQNRIELIRNMKHLQRSNDLLPDINRKLINEYDERIFKLIQYTPDTLTMGADIEETIKVDTLLCVRELTKLLWENGSFSTQTFTTHNHLHGDKLLLTYYQFRAKKSIRNLLNYDSIDIYPLIASFYLHDIGLLHNGDIEQLFNDTLKNIYNKISSKVREHHGNKSSDIIINLIASLLNLPKEWILPISYAAISHTDGMDYLNYGGDIRMKNNSYVLAILDLLDITFEREILTSRVITGSIASKETIKHWLKHYTVTSINFEITDRTITFFIGINKSLINDWEIQLNTKFDEETFFTDTHFGKFIIEQIDKYFLENVKFLFKNIGYTQSIDDIKTKFVVKLVDISSNSSIKFYDDSSRNKERFKLFACNKYCSHCK